MKKLFLTLFLFSFVLTGFADLYSTDEKDPFFYVRTLEFKKPGDLSYLRVYMKIPVASVELKKETTREGQQLYKSKVRFTVTLKSDGKELGKDSWKSTNLVADNLSSRLYIFDYTHFEVPAGKNVRIEVTVEDIYAKKENTVSISKEIEKFQGLAVSQPLWATDIRKLKPEDRSNTRFFSLYVNPIIDSVFYSPGYPLVYYEVYGLEANEDEEYNYTITYSISAPKEAPFYEYRDVKKGEFLEAGDIIEVPAPPVLDILSLVPSGKWSIKIQIDDHNSGKTAFIEDILEKKL